MSKFKVGDWVKCIDGDNIMGVMEGCAYQIQAYDDDVKVISVVNQNGCTYSLGAYRFEPMTELHPVPSDQPILSDIDRIRLETAKPLAVWYRSEGYKDALTYALGDADELINLIMDNPFIRTK